MAQLAVGWVLSNPNVASMIIGASPPEQGPEFWFRRRDEMQGRIAASLRAAVPTL